MKLNKLYNIWTCLLLTFLMYSCKDYDSIYTGQNEQQSKVFHGTLLEYLEKGDPDLGIHFDSMMLVINGIPGMRDSLSNPNADVTVFAVPNPCFEESFKRLNDFRSMNSKGKGVYIKDLLIEPFVVIEKLPGATPEADSIIIEHPYDYRLQLDSMFCKYIFKGQLTTDALKEYPSGIDEDAFKYNYRMNLLSRRLNASGIEQMGKKELFLSDKNNSQLNSKWDRSTVQSLDIKTSNGIIHILTNGHEFSFSKLISRFQNYGNEYIY
jgi:hypothetical protein